jgi:hypothetical protein
MVSTNICYTGIGSHENGNHTRKEFLDVMTKHFKQKCSQYTKSLKCKSCKEVKKQSTNEVIKQIEAHKKNKTYKISKQKHNSINKLRLKCDKCQKKNTRKCRLKEYIDFSGAEAGKC